MFIFFYTAAVGLVPLGPFNQSSIVVWVLTRQICSNNVIVIYTMLLDKYHKLIEVCSRVGARIAAGDTVEVAWGGLRIDTLIMYLHYTLHHNTITYFVTHFQYNYYVSSCYFFDFFPTFFFAAFLFVNCANINCFAIS
jgi:hypothetical protein